MYIMDLLKYSILKLNISPILKDKYGRDEYNLECIKKIDGNLLRKTITTKQKFMKIDNVKFKNPVYPGDTLIFKLELITPIRRGICHMKGYTFANGKITTEGELMAQIVRKDSI